MYQIISKADGQGRADMESFVCALIEQRDNGKLKYRAVI